MPLDYSSQSATLDAPNATGPDRELLATIRQRFSYATDCWRESKEERTKDIRALQGRIWSDEDEKARKDAGRPCLNQDELNQYVNQAVNNIRQNKREMKVAPDGDGATEATSNLQEDLLRTLQKNSRAANVYVKSFQDMVEGSYGFYRIGRKRKPGKRDQVITVKAIANPDSVLFDPDCKEPDWSDGKYCFVLDPIPRDEFKRRWPKAQKTSFSSEDARVAEQWIKDKTVLICEYWYLEEKDKDYSDDDGDWTDKEYQLYQVFTNGVEILGKTEQPGSILPIIPMMGLERWVNEGTGPKRQINSLVRLAREPQMALAYLVSAEAEDAGMTPKTPYEGDVGQFETDAETLATITKIPHSFVQFDIVYDQAGQARPRPTRTQYVPNCQAFEIGIDSKRRAIQSAMGITPLPTAAQRDNQKSGVALDKITQQTSIGSYHFVDKFEMSLDLGCRVILGWMPPTYVGEREESLEGRDGKRRLVTLNAANPPINEKTQQPEMVDVSLGNHTPDITTGPNEQSQQEVRADFVDNLIQQLPNYEQAFGPQKTCEIFAEGVKMRPELGIEGERIVEILVPPNDPSQQIAQMQQQAALSQKQMADMAAEIQKLKLAMAGKVIEMQGRKDIELIRIDADIAKSEIATKAQNQAERQEFVQEVWTELHGAAHDVALQKDQQAHEQNLAQQQAEQQAASQQSDQQHQAGMAVLTQPQPSEGQ